MSQTTQPFAILNVALLVVGATTAPYAISNVALSPPAGKAYVEVAGLPWTPTSLSLLEGADPAAVVGDLIESDTTTTPGGFSVTVYPDGTFSLGNQDDGTQQSFEYRLWRRADTTWYGPETVTLADTTQNQPQPQTTELYEIYAVGLNAPSGKVYVSVDSLPWDPSHLSILDGANPAATTSDVIRHDAVTSPSAFPVLVYPDGTFELLDDDGSLQTFQYSLWRRDTWSWAGPETVTLQSDLPQSTGHIMRWYNHVTGEWVPGEVKYWNGTEWVEGTLRFHEGGEWQ